MNFILFADDTNLFISHKSSAELMNIINQELTKLCEWFSSNKLMLNIKKTSYMIFGRKGKCIDGNFTVKISNSIIERVKYTKFLGVYFDEDLN